MKPDCTVRINMRHSKIESMCLFAMQVTAILCLAGLPMNPKPIPAPSWCLVSFISM